MDTQPGEAFGDGPQEGHRWAHRKPLIILLVVAAFLSVSMAVGWQVWHSMQNSYVFYTNTDEMQDFKLIDRQIALSKCNEARTALDELLADKRQIVASLAQVRDADCKVRASDYDSAGEELDEALLIITREVYVKSFPLTLDRAKTLQNRIAQEKQIEQDFNNRRPVKSAPKQQGPLL